MIANRSTRFPVPHGSGGAASGVMSDGRPFRLDVWNRGEVWMFMFHFSSLGIETLDATALAALLEREALVKIHDRGMKWLSAHTRDARGHLMHGVGTVSRDQRGTSVEILIPIASPTRDES